MGGATAGQRCLGHGKRKGRGKGRSKSGIEFLWSILEHRYRKKMLDPNVAGKGSFEQAACSSPSRPTTGSGEKGGGKPGGAKGEGKKVRMP